MKILVTGGAGYIGSHTTVKLLERGHEVIIIDNLSNSSKNIIDGISLITGKKPIFYEIDLRDELKLLQIYGKLDIDAVIHFAAAKAVGESVERPLYYYDNNLVSLINVLKNCLPIVFSSSCTVYGQPNKLPVTEKSPIIKAESPYGNTKQIGEEIIYDSVKGGITEKAISLRYFNPIGAHESGLIGELPRGIPQNLLPYIVQTASGKRDHLRIFGNDYNTPDGTCIRDYIDVNDLAEAHVIAVERLINNKNSDPYEVFNLGTGRGLSVLDIIKSFTDATEKFVDFKFYPKRKGDIEQIWADVSKANNILDWHSTTPIKQTMINAWNWELNYKKHGI